MPAAGHEGRHQAEGLTMPIKTTAYLCVYRCGQKSQTKRSRIEEHETRCAMNPALKTCKTCKHDMNAGHEDGQNIGFYCDIDKKPEQEMDTSTGIMRPIELMRNCPYWETKRKNKET